MDKRDVQKYYERPFAVENDIDLAVKDIPGIYLESSQTYDICLEATKISHGYLDLKITKIG
jgi:hypothetical protein